MKLRQNSQNQKFPTKLVGILESLIDEKGRMLIPREVRESVGMKKGTVVKVKQKGKIVEVTPTNRQHRTWKDMYGIRPKRTAKPSWPTPEEIKSIWV